VLVGFEWKQSTEDELAGMEEMPGQRLARSRRRSLTAAAVGVVGYAALQLLGRTAGSTARERRQVLPGDEIVLHPNAVTNHAVTIPAPPEQIWPWLMQMGWHRGGYYTPSWVDRMFFPANWPSLDVLDPQLSRELVPGDTIPDGPPGTAWFVVRTAWSQRRWCCTPPRTSRRHGRNAEHVSTGRGPSG
jgi:hypothetical protein